VINLLVVKGVALGAVKVSRVDLAVNYLKTSQFNSSLSLCREAPHVAPNTYWVVGDNLLAYKAFELAGESSYANAVKSKIMELANTYNLPKDGKGLPVSYAHEAVIGDVVPYIPFRGGREYSLYKDAYELKTVIYDGSQMTDWQQYADLLIYASLSYHWQGMEADALNCFNQAKDMWDGMGLMDKWTAQYGLYSTYKLSLLYYDSVILKQKVPGAVIRRIWQQQDSDGGIITEYDFNGNPVGDTNTETTAITVIAFKT
jgi:hypothetical protein